MKRNLLDHVGELRTLGINAGDVAVVVARVVNAEGAQLVSLSDEARVYVTPVAHPFSQGMLKQYSDRVVGSYDKGVTADDICEDLIAQWKADREAIA